MLIIGSKTELVQGLMWVVEMVLRRGDGDTPVNQPGHSAVDRIRYGLVPGSVVPRSNSSFVAVTVPSTTKP